MQAWLEAGALLIELEAENPTIVDDLVAKTGISDKVFNDLRRIGLKQLHPHLLIQEGAGPLMLQRMPYEIQERHLSKPVEVLISKGDSYEPLMIELCNLTRDQANQAFDYKGKVVRTPAAQRAYIADKQMREASPVVAAIPAEPYRINRKKLEINRPCTFTKKELARLLMEMEDND